MKTVGGCGRAHSIRLCAYSCGDAATHDIRAERCRELRVRAATQLPGLRCRWNDEMVALFDLALGLGLRLLQPLAPAELPDIVCHACKKVLYTTPAIRKAPARKRRAAELTPDAAILTPKPATNR